MLFLLGALLSVAVAVFVLLGSGGTTGAHDSPTPPVGTGTQPPATGTQPPATGTQPPATGTQPPATGTAPPTQPAGKGCTPGYWKNHEEVWDGVGGDDVTSTVQSTDLFNATFGVTSAQSGKADSVTLIEAAATGGGGLKALGRHAAAALASADAGIGYPYTVAQVIAIYQDAVGAIAGPETVSSAHAKFEAANEAGCPL